MLQQIVWYQSFSRVAGRADTVVPRLDDSGVGLTDTVKSVMAKTGVAQVLDCIDRRKA